MEIVIAPDKFKDTLTAAEAAGAIADGIDRAARRAGRTDVRLILKPMADGGEGSLGILAGDEGEYHPVETFDALMRPVQSAYAVLPGNSGKYAAVEAASAVGLYRLDREERNPLRTTSYGVGKVMREAIEAGCTELIAAVGGTATSDCGAGMLAALGCRFLDGQNRLIDYPAGGDLIVGLTSTALSKYLFLVGDDGTITGEVDEKIRVELARPAPADVSFPLALDNSLVEAYNEEHGTSYEAIDPARVSLGTLSVAAGDFMSDEASVTVSSANIEKGYYLLPIVVELPQGDVYTSKEKLVRYVLVTVAAMEIDVDATALTGVKIEPASGWTIVCYQGTASSGANGVWNLDSDTQKARMFDGKLDSNCWYAASASYSWGNGGNFIITLDKAYDINGFRWHIYYEDSNPECTDFQYSEDGTNWFSLTNEISFVPKLTDEGWKIFRFKKTVKARYIRVYVGRVTGYTSMNEAEIFAPAN